MLFTSALGGITFFFADEESETHGIYVNRVMTSASVTFPKLQFAHHPACRVFCISLIHLIIHPLQVLLPKPSTLQRSYLSNSSSQQTFLPASSTANQVSRIKQGPLCALKVPSICHVLFPPHSILLSQTKCASHFLRLILPPTLILSPPDFSINLYYCSYNLSSVYSVSGSQQHPFYFNCNMLSLSY